MGKRLPSATNLKDYARVAAERITTARRSQPLLKSLASPIEEQHKEKEEKPGVRSIAGGGGQGKAARGGMEGAAERREQRLPLAEVVSDCVRRWFQDALKEARAGDAAMQVLVGQMYQSGYGVTRSEQKAKAWMTKASKYRSSVWKVSNKRPGYNASDSDSDSDDVKNDKS